MGKSLVSVGAIQPSMMDGDPISNVLNDRDRRAEIDALLDDCQERIHALLLSKRHVVEGVRDALLEREELIGDEIEALMAELGEREPIEVPIPAIGGTAAATGDGHGRGPAGGNGGGGSWPQPPPRPDRG
jgi:hypothetical protein